MNSAAPQSLGKRSTLGRIAAWGPGVLVMLADTDAGNVVTSAQAGATWGYRLLPLLVLLIPVLYMVQELTVRLGLATGQGFGDLIRQRFGRSGCTLALLALTVAVIGSLVTEFTGVAGVGELYGLPRVASLTCAALGLLAIVGTGSYRRAERTAIIVGLFELAFFVVAWAAHPRLSALAQDATDLPIGNRQFLYLVAAVIGAVFNPWMIFYQQSAIAEKKLGWTHLKAARFDTAFGAVLTQSLTGAILIAVAAALRGHSGSAGLDSIGQISEALSPLLGSSIGRAVFGFGVLSASLVAAIVCSLAMAWGVGEVIGHKHALEQRSFANGWFYAVFVACVIGSAALVAFVPDLVWLNVAAQVLNTMLLPIMLAFLVVLAITVLPERARPGGLYRAVIIAACTIVTCIGVYGGLAGLL